MDTPVSREEIHHRRIDLRFFRRSDGLFEIEAQLVDTKTHPFRRQLSEEDTPAGAPVHDIVVRLVVDETMTIHDAQASMQTTPFVRCRGVENTLAPLIGLRMGAGWNRRVRELLGGAASCTHVVELLGPMATTAYQGLAPQRLAQVNDPSNEDLRLAKIDSCFAYAGDGDVVARLWPAHARAPANKGPAR